MSKFNSREGFAAGLAASGLILLIVHLLLSLGQPINNSANTDNEILSQNNGENKNNSEPSENAFWHWDGSLIKSSDTAAQWIMTFFTIIAAGLLYFTLRSANKTNEAAIQANKIMAESFLIDQRAWLTLRLNSIGPITVSADGIVGIEISVSIENTGKTPVSGFYFLAETYYLFNNDRNIMPDFLKRAVELLPGAGHVYGPLGPGERRVMSQKFSINMDEFNKIQGTNFNTHRLKCLIGIPYQTIIPNKVSISFKEVAIKCSEIERHDSVESNSTILNCFDISPCYGVMT